MAKTKSNARVVAVQVLHRLLQQQGSISSELKPLSFSLDKSEQAFVQELCYGTCRWYFWLEQQVNPLLKKPLKVKDQDIYLLILIGVYQLLFTRVAAHAAINETVNCTESFRKHWAKGLVNGVLRGVQRQLPEDKNIPPQANWDSHPQWLISALKQAWSQPEKTRVESIITANNQHPPFTLRVNTQEISRENYQQQLQSLGLTSTLTPYSSYGITMNQAVNVTELPDFSQGLVSVQDEAAQLTVDLLQLEAGQRVLDACCAPGGKTCHIAQREPDLQKLVAIESEQRRLARVSENLSRLSIASVELIHGDASQPDDWWDGLLFDRILLDAPCSATGVIRRHPDIKLLRTPEAVVEMAALQQRLLNALWPLLADGGILLYATCSILPEENTNNIEQFIKGRKDIQVDELLVPWGIEQPFGRQLFPQANGHDGFYYCRLRKVSTEKDS